MKPHLTLADREQLAALMYEWLEGPGEWPEAKAWQKKRFRETAEWIIVHWRETKSTMGEANE